MTTSGTRNNQKQRPNMKFSVRGCGRLTGAPESKTTQSGTNVCSFSVAVNGSNKEDVQFIRCRAFGKTAEFVAKYFTKGKPVEISGYWAQYTAQGKDGTSKTYDYIEVSNASFVPSDPTKKTAAAQPETDGIEDDDIPF